MRKEKSILQRRIARIFAIVGYAAFSKGVAFK